VCLEFGVTAFSDEVSIDSLSIKKPDESEDELVYEGPEFT
jgi:complement component 1 Q subcomponent-binding protein